MAAAVLGPAMQQFAAYGAQQAAQQAAQQLIVQQALLRALEEGLKVSAASAASSAAGSAAAATAVKVASQVAAPVAEKAAETSVKAASTGASQVLPKVLATGVGALAVGLQVGVQVKEMVDLAKSWEATHPSASAINSVLSSVEADCSRYKRLLQEVTDLVKDGSHGQMKNSISKLIDAYESLGRKLRSKRSEIEEHQKDCNVAKTVGTGFNLVGTATSVAGLVLIPFTGGLSLGLTAAGLGSTAVGLTTNVVTNVIDSKATARFTEEIQRICNSVQEAINEMMGHVNAVREKVEDLRAETAALQELSNLLDHNFGAFMKESYPECRALLAHILPAGKIDEALLRRIVEILLKGAVLLAAMQEEWVNTLQKVASWFQPQNKDKTKAKVLEIIGTALRTAKAEWEREKDKKKEQKKRGDHVINAGVLKIFKDIQDDFVNKAGINRATLVTSHQLAEAREDRDNPLQSQRAHHFVETTVVFMDGLIRPVADTNAVLFGAAAFILRTMSVRHMKKLFENNTYDWYRHGTTSTAMIRFMCGMMNECRLLANEPIYVDEEAKNLWLKQGGNLADFSFAKEKVQLMFGRLYERLKIWVIQFRSAAGR